MKPIVPPVFPWKDHTKYTYPLGLDINGVCFLSGNSASEYDAQASKIVIKGDLPAQIDTALAKIRAVLQEAGLSLADVVSVVQYVTPQIFGSIAKLGSILGSYGIEGASSHIVPVNRLMRREALIELEVIAARANQRKAVGQSSQAIRVFSETNGLVLVGEMESKHEGPSSCTLAGEVERIERLLQSFGMNWTDVGRSRLILATESSNELDAAVAKLKTDVPSLPIMPAIGVAQLPSNHSHISVEMCVLDKSAEPSRAVHGGLIRQSGSFLMATGLQSHETGSGLVEQVEQIYSSVVPGLLADAGMGVQNIVQTVEWVTEEALPDYRQTGATRRKFLKEPFPVASGLVCSALPNGRKVSVDILASSE